MLKKAYTSAHELQRYKVLTQSLFGIWQDADGTIELKISPLVGGAKIKIWAVNDFSAIEKIAAFCGLSSLPKRTQWQGFDLITNLERKSEDSFANGIVNMPNNKRKNSADFNVSENTGHLDFFYFEFCQKSIVQNKSGSIVLTQKRLVNSL
jgi:hypothetical protein